MGNKDEKRKKENMMNAVIAGGSSEIVQRYGSAAKEHLVAYSGIDNETGKQLQKSLKSIAEEKLNSNYKQQNLKQQAGFAAEVKETANANADAIIKGSKNRKIRTDDLGRVNDPLYDHVTIDSNGNIIAGSGSQMKFVGNDPKDALSKLTSKKFEKYLDNDAKIEVPSDYYQGILDEANNRIDELQKQLDTQLKNGNTEQAEKIRRRIEKYKKIKKNLRKSTVSNKEAMFARKHPKLSTAKSIAKVAHGAGMEAAGISAAVGGSVSMIQNIVATVKGDETIGEAAVNVTKDTAKTAAVGYATGFSGSVVKSMMQNAKSQTVRGLSKTNLPSSIVSVATTTTKTFKRYFDGEIDGVECFEELGQEGVGLISSSMFGIVGQMAIPIPGVGLFVGNMVGYVLATSSYGVLVSALKEAKLARAERIRIERECAEHIKLIREYRAEMERVISEYLVSYMEIFHDSFDGIKKALEIGDIDGYISSVNNITKALGGEVLFESLDEFDLLMSDKNTILEF